jgi:hypothetical protein
MHEGLEEAQKRVEKHLRLARDTVAQVESQMENLLTQQEVHMDEHNEASLVDFLEAASSKDVH